MCVEEGGVHQRSGYKCNVIRVGLLLSISSNRVQNYREEGMCVWSVVKMDDGKERRQAKCIRSLTHVATLCEHAYFVWMCLTITNSNITVDKKKN